MLKKPIAKRGQPPKGKEALTRKAFARLKEQDWKRLEKAAKKSKVSTSEKMREYILEGLSKDKL